MRFLVANVGAVSLLFFSVVATVAHADTVAPPVAVPPGHVTGLGGIVVKSKNPKALAAWYKDVLGLDILTWGGAKLPYDAPGHPDIALWATLPEKTDEMAPSTREFMVVFAVDNMDAFVTRLASKGVNVLKREDQRAFGKFAYILDPDGTKIELWQPK